VSLGWLRASHRKLTAASTEYRPFHQHTEREPLVRGEIYEVEVEIWPTSLLIPEGYRIALSVRGNDFDHGLEGARLKHFCNGFRGVGPFIHDEPAARREEIRAATVTLHTGPEHPSSLLLPVVPARGEPRL
jgi:predicted acyl esterase